jgi:hypothetical protein
MRFVISSGMDCRSSAALAERQSSDFELFDLEGATTERVMETRTQIQSPDRALEQKPDIHSRIISCRHWDRSEPLRMVVQPASWKPLMVAPDSNAR